MFVSKERRWPEEDLTPLPRTTGFATIDADGVALAPVRERCTHGLLWAARAE
ncbi:MAG: hypothetical protein WCJ67_11180 [Thermoleophilia bacterium]